MGDTSIEWTEKTWNPLSGCTKVSPGCDHCYAKTMHERFHGPGSFDTVTLHPERLTQPLRWRKPSRVFVNSMSDLFHKDVPDEYIARVFSVMRLAPKHTFQVLTKRHARMRSLMNSAEFQERVWELGGIGGRYGAKYPHLRTWPSPNVWLGVSVETQHWADIRIPALLDTPAAVRFLSCEPLLGPVRIDRYLWRHTAGPFHVPARDLHWVIGGGESGPGARPMHPDWARSLRDQCDAARVPFHFKQYGAWTPITSGGVRIGDICMSPDGDTYTVDRDYICAHNESEGAWLRRVGKKAAGRVLDGRTWDEYPS